MCRYISGTFLSFTFNLLSQPCKIRITSKLTTARPCYLNRPHANPCYLNRSVTFKIMPLDLFPRTDISTILSLQIFTLKSREAFISSFSIHLLINPCYQSDRLNVEREHQVDVWYVFFVLSVLGNRSIVVFMGVFCSSE